MFALTVLQRSVLFLENGSKQSTVAYCRLYCIFSEPFLLGLQYLYFYEKSFHHRQVDRKLNPVVDFLLRCQPTHKEACKEYKNHLTDCYVLENIFEKFFSIHFLVCIGINESPTTKLTKEVRDRSFEPGPFFQEKLFCDFLCKVACSLLQFSTHRTSFFLFVKLNPSALFIRKTAHCFIKYVSYK